MLKEGKNQQCKQILIPSVFKKDLFVNVYVIKNLVQISVCPSLNLSSVLPLLINIAVLQ